MVNNHFSRAKRDALPADAPLIDAPPVNAPAAEVPPPKTIHDFPRDLHRGCGGRRAPGFCNVDITEQASVDMVDNVAALAEFPDNYANSIYACHVLEHFSHAEAPEVLRTWFRVLAPGGRSESQFRTSTTLDGSASRYRIDRSVGTMD